MASITFTHVRKTYPGGVTVIPDLNLEIADKEFVVLAGPSGCGKSTTLQMIAGLEDISGGELRIGGRVVNDVAPKDRDIAAVFQNPALYPHMTVYNNIAFSLIQKKLPRDEVDRRVREAARTLDLEHVLSRRPKTLSVVQRRRTALGRAMVRNPAVFLLDDPMSSLDAGLRASMRAEIRRLHERMQTTFVYVTRDQTEAMTMGDRIVVMKDGVIQQSGAPRNLCDYPRSLFVAGFMGSPQMNFIDVTIVREDGVCRARAGGRNITLPERMGRGGLDAYAGRTVILGIRPEDIRPAVADQTADLEARIETAEPMGGEICLHLNFQGRCVVVRAPSGYTGREGDIGRMVMDKEKIHLFDKETEEAIAH